MKVGFVGSRYGGTEYQHELLDDLLKLIEPSEVHHGDRKGADEKFHLLCQELKIPIVVHPPNHDELRAFCVDYKQIHEPKSYISRNKDIVNDTDVLIAIPNTLAESFHSDTWATIRYAKKYLKPIITIMLDGTVIEENID